MSRAERAGFEPAPVHILPPVAGDRARNLGAVINRGVTVTRPLTAIIAIALAACAPIEQRPPEQRTQVVEVKVPVPVPCFTEAERPILPPPTPIDIDNATTDQLAAALAADDANEALFAKLVDALFLQCLKSTGGTK